MNDPRHDPSIENEPHLRGGKFEADPSEAKAGGRLRPDGGHDEAERSIWDEPAHSAALTGGPPEGAITYADWLAAGIARTPAWRGWLTALLVAAAAGPWAIFGTLLSGRGTGWHVAALVLFAPVVEEMMKISAALWVVEKRPFRFTSGTQIALCGLAGGFVFAAVENLLYLRVYIPDPSPGLVQWRWTICVLMHMGCSLVASLGLVRIWSRSRRDLTRPRLELGAPAMIAAMVLHGAYNGVATVLELRGFGF